MKPVSILLLLTLPLFSQREKPIYDEAKIPAYTLPDPLMMEGGKNGTTREEWLKVARPKILSLFETHVYGKTPKEKIKSSRTVVESGKVFGGAAERKQVVITFRGNGKSLQLTVLCYLPATGKPSPIVLAPNFKGNHTILDDGKILITELASKNKRGERSNRWPVEKILKAGYGLVTFHYEDIDPDKHDGFQNGIHPLFFKKDQTKPAPDEWGSIGAWAWGMSRIVDDLETDPAIDSKRIVLMGHSRLGKTALWAGAQDERFAIVISNNSGCGGAALARRRFGESVKRINTSFPHWFCENHKKFNHNENALPVDQHMLIALIAPRPVYIASAVQDRWADPKGEFLSAKLATPVYELYGKKGITVENLPPLNQPTGEHIRYHIREGKHDVTDYDWQQYLAFADRHLKTKP